MEAFMLVEYALKRGEVFKGYFRAFNCLPSFRNRMLTMAVTIGIMTIPFSYASKHKVEIVDAAFAILWAIGFLIFMALWLWIRTKTEIRHLRIDEFGLSTTIGKLTGEIPWAKVSLVSDLGNFIFIGGKNMNFFLIPNRAFSEDQDRAQLLKIAKQRFAHGGGSFL
jgi:hypothetical protein